MKHFIFGAVLCASAVIAKEYKIDANQSQVVWKGAKVAGPHDGTVKIKEGTVSLDGSNLKSAHVVVDMTTIVNRDVESAEWKKKLEDHLKSDDFFNIAKFPTAEFKLKEFKGGKATGDLTIKGITKPMTVPVDVMVAGQNAKAKIAFKINRLDYEIRYNSGKFFDPKALGDKLIYDDIEFALDLTATEQVTTKAAATTKETKKK